ncbi:MAG TPA: hypothetical protein VFT45_16450 [Longimicrobium sp.]|nr:hypothetical protein [Longimicrobium sp.]
MRVSLKGPVLAIALSIGAHVPVALHAMPERSPAVAATPDTAALRQALATAFGEDFEIARTELSEGVAERGGAFWLVHARPRRSGDYELRYRYDYRDRVRPHDPLYTHVEHTSYIRVGERGCWRRREGKDVCLGDTIILPFVVDDHTGHVFTLGRRGSSAGSGVGETPPVEMATEVDSVANPLSAHLRYVGTRSYEMLRRNGGGTTVLAAEFQAVAPGSFNLSLWETPSPAGSIPIVIVPRGQPVTVLLANETVEGTDQVQGFSSHSGNQYLTTVLLLQPGDRITLEYHHRSFTAREEFAGHARSDRMQDAAPLITRFPFHLDAEQRFNAWIAPHLPTQPPR